MTNFIILMQVKDAASRQRGKQFRPNACMRLTNFNVLTRVPRMSCISGSLNVMVNILSLLYPTCIKVLQQSDLIKLDKHGVAHPILSNEAVATFFRKTFSDNRKTLQLPHLTVVQ
jgi:hypothetical protein